MDTLWTSEQKIFLFRQRWDLTSVFLFQIAEINIRHEQEKAQTLRAHQIERDSSLKEQEQEKVSKLTPCLETLVICSNNTPTRASLGIKEKEISLLIELWGEKCRDFVRFQSRKTATS